MPLSEEQRQGLKNAIQSYAFPRAYFDFSENIPRNDLSMMELEERVRSDLTSGSDEQVRDGLSAILYWGYAQMGGLGVYRSTMFRGKVEIEKIQAAKELFARDRRPTLLDIKRLKIPEFSGVSFISKIRMFLDPENSAVLDKQIMQIHIFCPETVLANIVYRNRDSQIRATRANSVAYEDWCDRLAVIRKYYVPEFRVADIERGFFQLVQSERPDMAAEILRNG